MGVVVLESVSLRRDVKRPNCGHSPFSTQKQMRSKRCTTDRSCTKNIVKSHSMYFYTIIHVVAISCTLGHISAGSSHGLAAASSLFGGCVALREGDSSLFGDELL